MKSVIITIMGWALVALIVPVLGNTYVEGWNWNWHDFLFAWVFWVVMGMSIYLIARQCGRYRWLVGILVFLCFAAVWAMLATG